MMSSTGDDGSQLLQKIRSALGKGDFAQASDLAEAVLARGIDHPLAHKARALRLDALGRAEDALASFLAAQRLDPSDPLTLNGIAISLGRLGRMDDAMKAFAASLALAPDLATTHFQKGWVLDMAGDAAAALPAYARATEIAPHHASAWAGRAAAHEALNDWPGAKLAAQRGLALDPLQPRAIATLAATEIHDGQFASAEARLRIALEAPGFVPAHLRPAMFGLLADALDGLGRPDDAFAFYTAENDARREMFPLPQMDLTAIAKLLIGFCESAELQPATSYVAPCREHVFLLGFQRSGTTLLEQVLASHPDVTTLEERDVLEDTAQQFLVSVTGLQRLSALSGQGLEFARDLYWRRVAAFGTDPSGKVFVDKLPLHTIKLPLIAALFPEAKILFALRDPRDVVLSCFRRHFKINPSTYPFLTLRGTAEFYDGVMRLGARAREKFPLAFHLHRHEDLIADFDGEMRRICRFLDLGWDDRFRDFASIAEKRTIRSMSASQVRSGLSNAGAGQWRRYATHLAPVMPILQPWVDEFGYT